MIEGISVMGIGRDPTYTSPVGRFSMAVSMAPDPAIRW
jgi:hypothetical protein